MNIHPVKQVNFKGYDARPLRGFLMNTNEGNIARSMFKIGKKEGFIVYTISGTDIFKNMSKDIDDSSDPWAQDIWTFYKDKLQTSSFCVSFDALKKVFSLNADTIEKNTYLDNLKKCHEKRLEITLKRDNATSEEERTKYYWESIKVQEEFENKPFHIAGGNIFFIKDGDKGEVIVGENALKIYSVEDIKKMYSTDKVIVLPQMDFHLDLFIRPLDNKRVLLADDDMTLDVLKNNMQKIEEYAVNLDKEEQKVLNRVIKKYQKAIEEFAREKALNKFATADQVEPILTQSGFEVIRVPGRIYKTASRLFGKKDSHNNDLIPMCNYINANVLINPDGDLVYITNNSSFDKKLGITPKIAQKVGCSFEEAFIKSISPYVKKEHIYFIKGEKNLIETMLSKLGGGIHCVCAEIPESKKIE